MAKKKRRRKRRTKRIRRRRRKVCLNDSWPHLKEQASGLPGAGLGLLQSPTFVQVCWGRSEDFESLHPGTICARLSPFTALIRPRRAGSSPRTWHPMAQLLVSTPAHPGSLWLLPEGSSMPIPFLFHHLLKDLSASHRTEAEEGGRLEVEKSLSAKGQECRRGCSSVYSK